MKEKGIRWSETNERHRREVPSNKNPPPQFLILYRIKHINSFTWLSGSLHFLLNPFIRRIGVHF